LVTGVTVYDIETLLLLLIDWKSIKLRTPHQTVSITGQMGLNSAT